MLAAIVSVTWVTLCLALAGWPGPACGALVETTGARAGPGVSWPPESPSADPSPVRRVEELLPPGPEDPDPLRGRPPGVMS